MSERQAAMHNRLSTQQLTDLLQLTRQMLAYARQNDWDGVSALDTQRMKLLDQQLVDAVEDNSSATDIDLSGQLMSVDAQLLALAREHRNRLGEAGSQRQAQRVAKHHYAVAQRLVR